MKNFIPYFITILSGITFILLWLAVYGFSIKYWRKHIQVNDWCVFKVGEQRAQGVIIHIRRKAANPDQVDNTVWVEWQNKVYVRTIETIYPI